MSAFTFYAIDCSIDSTWGNFDSSQIDLNITKNID